jgi:hypothetical protein
MKRSPQCRDRAVAWLNSSWRKHRELSVQGMKHSKKHIFIYLIGHILKKKWLMRSILGRQQGIRDKEIGRDFTIPEILWFPSHLKIVISQVIQAVNRE